MPKVMGAHGAKKKGFRSGKWKRDAWITETNGAEKKGFKSGVAITSNCCNHPMMIMMPR